MNPSPAIAIDVQDLRKVYRSSTGEPIVALDHVSLQVPEGAILRFSLLGVGAPAAVMAETAAFAVFALACLAVAVRTIDRAA